MASRQDPSGDATMTALITQQLTAVITTLATHLNQANQRNNPPHCNCKHSNSCFSPKSLSTLTHNDHSNSQLKSTPFKPVKEASAEPLSTPKHNNRKRKAKNYATNKKRYSGNHPLCNTCQYHHSHNVPCRNCTNCGNFGHTQSYCRIQPQPNQPRNTNFPTNINPNPKACFECGDPNHFKNQCPKLVIQGSRGRALNISTSEACNDNNVVNGTFLVNARYTSILFKSNIDKCLVPFKFE